MTVTVAWSSAADWGLFDEVPVSTPDNILTLGAAGGKGTVVAATTAGAGNDRRLFLLKDPALRAVDWECRLSFRLTGGLCQTGIAMRVHEGLAPVSWQNVIFAATGNLLPGVWEYTGAALSQTNQQAGESRLWGAPVVSASGNGTAVTVTTEYDHLITAGEVITHESVGSFGQVTVASTPTATTYTFASAVAGSWTGGRYRWVIAPADRFRTQAVRLVGSTLTHKQWVPPHPEPDWDDATNTVTQVLPSSLLGGGRTPTTAGRVGIVVAHLDDSAQGRTLFLDDFTVTSLDAAEEGGSWGTLTAILAEARERRAEENAAEPESCPLCGDVLMVHPRTGERRCPTGDGYTWP